MGRTLYLDTSFGISGDMTVGALIDLGADQDRLKAALASLGLEGYRIEISRKQISAISCVDFDVVTGDRLDHDMEYLYGNACVPDHHHGSHHHRGLREIYDILDASALSERAKATAKKVFGLLGEAEARVHGVSPEEVHFHEAGAVDSIVDIAAVAWCLDDLDAENIIVTGLSEGTGTVRCQHGVIPVPVPAVTEIVRMSGMKLSLTADRGEYVTPTGAALAGALRSADVLPDSFTIEAVGLGAGKRVQERPALLRAMFIARAEAGPAPALVKLETNIDDSTGETLGFVLEELMARGALDAWYTPIYMKKCRPAYMLSCLCEADRAQELESLIFRATTTIGVRREVIERTACEREIIEVATPLGPARVKKVRLPGAAPEYRYYPEYESVAGYCRETGLSPMEVSRIIADSGTGQEPQKTGPIFSSESP